MHMDLSANLSSDSYFGLMADAGTLSHTRKLIQSHRSTIYHVCFLVLLVGISSHLINNILLPSSSLLPITMPSTSPSCHLCIFLIHTISPFRSHAGSRTVPAKWTITKDHLNRRFHPTGKASARF
ncbi:hypothetical protein N7G274_003226 [Stereocaulon virgatum]|uniref:Uncharacterized protein n=1 Tax=Stereocaulon virgatum TaxID=373712 RepID=A0ABR4AI70_9LECA